MAGALKIYSAESDVRDFAGFKSVIRSMISGLINSRYIAYRIFLKDVRAEYTKSMMGLVWDFVDPLVLGLVFYFLRRAQVINVGEVSIPYPVFIIYGMLLYQTFADSVLLPLNVMKRSSTMIKNLKLCPEALLLSSLYRIAFNSFFRIIVMLGFSLALGAFSIIGFLKFLIFFPAIILTGMAFGVLLAPFNTIYTDVDRITKIFLGPLRYASPVLYAIPNSAPFTYLYIVNPVALILSNLRSLATENLFLDGPGITVRICLLLIMFLIGSYIFHLSVPILAERS